MYRICISLIIFLGTSVPAAWNSPTDLPSNEVLNDGLQQLKLKLRQDAVTVSGFSSGGALASQFHVAYSHMFTGLGVFSAVYYRCAGDTRNKTYCFLEKGNTVENSIAEALKYESLDLIDPLKNLADQRVYIWLGTKDEQPIHIETRLHMVNFYQRFISNPNNIFTKVQAAYHLLPTDKGNQSCTEVTKLPDKFLGNCNYSGTYEMFNFLLGSHIRKPSANLELQPLRLFNQTVYLTNGSVDSGLDEIGMYYVPTNCQVYNQKTCLIHMYFHGCGLTRSLGGSHFIEKSGFLEVAEENEIVLIFPQAAVTNNNPKGCWDTDGKLDINYANKEAVQMSTLVRILESVLHTADNKNSAGSVYSLQGSFVHFIYTLLILLVLRQ